MESLRRNEKRGEEMGQIFVLGIGPGTKENMTFRAAEALKKSDVVIGYSKYIELVQDFLQGKEIISSSMRQEQERCRRTIELAEEGHFVSLISSGDSGIYGMAGILLQTAYEKKSDISIEIIPGVTSASAAAALLGAPLMHDFAVISLSDLLTPWEKIEKRIELSAQGDFVICIYNPKSKKRVDYIERAGELILKYRSSDTPVGIVRNAGRPGECVTICSLEKMKEQEIDMFSIVIIGNSQSYIEKGKMITPRGYHGTPGGEKD